MTRPGRPDDRDAVWDPGTGEQHHTFADHTDSINALAVDRRTGWLVSGGNDGTVRIWDAVVGKQRATLLASDAGWAALLTDGRMKDPRKPANLWWAAGLCRFEADDLPLLTRYRPELQPLPHDQVILDG